MSSSIPKDVRLRIQAKLWAKADEMGWARRSDNERAIWYENWAKANDIGGVIAHYMDPRKVRVYIKDSLLKPYQRTRLEEGEASVFAALGLSLDKVSVEASFIKPHGRLLDDGKVICWGNSRDWKTVLFSVFERSYGSRKASPYAAILIESGKSSDPRLREMITDASQRLGLRHLVWLE